MGKASRSKRARAVRSAKRSRNNSWWYGLTAIVLIAGIALVVYARNTEKAPIGPFVADPNQAPTSNVNLNSHWHTALGVYDCDKWLGNEGNGTWSWPGTSTSGINRVNSNVYAGLHSHDDGIIHMEPATSEDAGYNATLGRYFDYGGWSLSPTGYDFLGTKVNNGDKCGTKPGKLTWAVAKFNGDATKPQDYRLGSGDPSKYKLMNDEIIILAFLPDGKTAKDIGNPPSVANISGATQRGEQAHSQLPSNSNTPGAAGSTIPAARPKATTAPAAPTATTAKP